MYLCYAKKGLMFCGALVGELWGSEKLSSSSSMLLSERSEMNGTKTKNSIDVDSFF